MSGLEGLRVLVVEDEGPVAMLLEDMLEDLGCAVVGSAASVPEALEMLAELSFAFAVLDVNLAGRKIDPVAEALAQRGIPFAFASGYGQAGVRDDFSTRPIVQKPFHVRDLESAIRAGLGESRTAGS